jgi:hypothetical protein
LWEEGEGLKSTVRPAFFQWVSSVAGF